MTKFSDVVYYEPMSNEEILDVEKKIGARIKPLYREFLSSFGMTQDIFDELRTNIDSFFEDYWFIKDSLNGYLPIYSDIDEEDTIYLINNKDLQDEFVYIVNVDVNDKIGKIKKLKPFKKIIEESISDLQNNYTDRCLNRDKVNVTEFIISGNDFPAFVDIFKIEAIKQKTEWKPKYYPDNIFGDEIAIFELFEKKIIIERDDDKSQYRFELEEPILTDIEKSIICKTEQLLNVQRIEYEKIECKLIESE